MAAFFLIWFWGGLSVFAVIANPIEKQAHALDHGTPGADQDGTVGILSTKAPELGGWALLPTLTPPITMGVLTPH